MNAVFAAQRKDIPIDVCQLPSENLNSKSSLGLSQAASLTNSIYIHVEKEEMLLQYLLVIIGSCTGFNIFENSNYF